MYHVPGKYSGGEREQLKWTQTREEVDIHVALSSDSPLAKRDIKVRIDSTSLEVTVLGTTIVQGELSEKVVAGDSVWNIETDQSGKRIAINLRKQKQGLWSQLVTSDTTAEPTLLDPAKNRPAPLTDQQKAEAEEKKRMLKDVKEKYELDTMSNTVKKVVENITGSEVTYDSSLADNTVLVIKSCKDTRFTIAGGCSVVKVMVEGCDKCTFVLNGKIQTETIEMWNCTDPELRVNANVAKTIQVDDCNNVNVRYVKAEFLDRIVHCAVARLSVAFVDGGAEDTEISTDVEEEKEQQFITRILKGKSHVTTERIVRTTNEFPTTEREHGEYLERTSLTKKLVSDGAVNQLLSDDKLKSQLSEQEQQQLKDLAAQQQKAAEEAANAQLDNNKAQAEFKRTAGNEAFQDGNHGQAAVYYTESIVHFDGDHRVYSNRAACFLKLGRYDQALQDTDKCIELKPDFPKGHFRKGLALQAVERYPEAAACFSRTMQLEPSNKQAAGALQMVQMQIIRQKREAGN